MFNDDKKIASDNTVKNSLANFEVTVDGLDKIIMLFFPSMRNAFVERYRAQTIANIGIEAVRLANDSSITLNAIPPKAALPLIEEMSLEHEQPMYEVWAKLLVASASNFDPIQQQYAHILSNINSKQANLLKIVYNKQNSVKLEEMYDEYVSKRLYIKQYNDMHQFDTLFTHISQIPSFSFPHSIEGEAKLCHQNRFFDEEVSVMVLSGDQENMLLSLTKLGLIKYDICELIWEDPRITKYGMLLTNFGYSFIKCLETMK
ncbi:MAG: DUF4393 domain-containing protein [Deferribacteraceae bacterium]|jgi:hypothetical protein|nr:DUF4393 domain-containing protein [Deferribacteraceae bacterium]